jgi:predicted nucleotidyltransferase
MNPQIFLQEDLDKIINALKAYNPEKIILFGSVAKRVSKKSSDIDLFIIKQTKKRFTERAREVVLNHLSGVDYHRPIDLTIYTPEEVARAQEENRIFIREVLKYGKVLYEQKQTPR